MRLAHSMKAGAKRANLAFIDLSSQGFAPEYERQATAVSWAMVPRDNSPRPDGASTLVGSLAVPAPMTVPVVHRGVVATVEIVTSEAGQSRADHEHQSSWRWAIDEQGGVLPAQTGPRGYEQSIERWNE